MDALTLTEAEIAGLQTSPTLIVQTLNRMLGQAAFLAEHYGHLTGRSLGLNLPESVQVPAAASLGAIQYDASGMTAPRLDGCVRIRAWDDAVAAALGSSDPVTKAWGEAVQGSPWICIQDTLKSPLISTQQKILIGSNLSNARFMNTILGGRIKAFAFPMYQFYVDGEGNIKKGDLIADAFAVNDDRVDLLGKVHSRGWWASDIKRLAEQSLAHFIVTSGPAVLRALGE